MAKFKVNSKSIKLVAITSSFFLLIISIMIYFYQKDPARNYLYIDTAEYATKLIAAEDLQVGDIINDTNVKEVQVDKKDMYDLSDNLANKEASRGKKLLYPLKAGQTVYKNQLMSKEEWFDGTFPVAIPITVANSIAGKINKNDYIDICISKDLANQEQVIVTDSRFKNFDIVIAKKRIEDIRDGKGADATAPGQKGEFKGEYMIINLTLDERDKYMDSIKNREGGLFINLYEDPTAPANEETYVMGANIYGSIEKGEKTNESSQDNKPME